VTAALQVVSIVGPTASGKTKLSLALADRFDAEIVNLDAYQIYRAMDIGTAKPTASELAQVAHHLTDVVDIDFNASVSDFQQWAHAAIADITSRGKLAICVGGSGLYVRAVLDELDIPATHPDVRQKYNDLLMEHGEDWLHRLLAEVDPVAASVILPGNSRRVVRALEVNELTGAPFQATIPDASPMFRDVRIALAANREEIAQRIATRTSVMFDAGWPEEVALLDRAGLQSTPTASKALGYREVSLFNAGELTRDDAQALIAQATLKFSKRQMQWFSRDLTNVWLEWNRPTLLADASSIIAAAQR
jgi:tRNA dimethylallyltransferase